MADLKISQLTESTIGASDFVGISRSGSNYKLNLQTAVTSSLSTTTGTGNSADASKFLVLDAGLDPGFFSVKFHGAIGSTNGTILRSNNTASTNTQYLSDEVGETIATRGFIKPVYPASTFGILPDAGVSDQRALIQTAIDTIYTAGGGTLLFPAGTFKANENGSGVCIMHKTGVKLKGAGLAATFITTDNSVSVTAYNLIAPFGYNTATSPYGAHEIDIEDLTLTSTTFTAGAAADRLHNLIGFAHCPKGIALRVGFDTARAHYAEFNLSKNIQVIDCETVGTGNCGLAKFQLDNGGNAGIMSASARLSTSITGSATYASGTQTLLTVTSTTGMAHNDYVLLTSANGANAATYNAVGGYRITNVVSSTTVAISLAWPGAATTAGTITIQTPVENITIRGYKDKAGTITSEDVQRSFMDLSHTNSNGIYRNITVEECVIVPYTCTSTIGSGSTRPTMGFDSAALPLEFTGLRIINNKFIDGGHTGNTIIISLAAAYSATYPLRQISGVEISGNITQRAGMYSFFNGGDINSDSSVRTSIASTATQTWKNLLIENNIIQPVLRGGNTTYSRSSRIFSIGAGESAIIRNNRVFFPNVAPTNLNGLAWTSSTSSIYGFFIDHMRNLIMENNQVEVALTQGNADLYLSAFVFGVSAFELAASGPLSGHHVWINNKAIGTGSIANGIIRSFTELLTNGTTGISSWASATKPSITGVWRGNTFNTGGTPAVDTWSTDYQSYNTPLNGSLTTSITDASEAGVWGRHDWWNGEEVIQTFSNAAVTVDPLTTTLIQTGTMSASRVVTLPYATRTRPLKIIDISGTVTSTNTLVISRVASDTFANGATSVTIASAASPIILFPNGSTKWSNCVGEFTSALVASGAAVSLTTATSANVTSISLTAGDWDVDGVINYISTTATVTEKKGGISSVSATVPTDGSEVFSGVQLVGVTATDGTTISKKRFALAATTTIYLVANCTFSAGTVAVFGSINARRVL